MSQSAESLCKRPLATAGQGERVQEQARAHGGDPSHEGREAPREDHRGPAGGPPRKEQNHTRREARQARGAPQRGACLTP